MDRISRFEGIIQLKHRTGTFSRIFIQGFAPAVFLFSSRIQDLRLEFFRFFLFLLCPWRWQATFAWPLARTATKWSTSCCRKSSGSANFTRHSGPASANGRNSTSAPRNATRTAVQRRASSIWTYCPNGSRSATLDCIWLLSPEMIWPKKVNNRRKTTQEKSVFFLFKAVSLENTVIFNGKMQLFTYT